MPPSLLLTGLFDLLEWPFLYM